MRVTILAFAIGAAAIPVLSAFVGCGGNVAAASAGTGGHGGTSTTGPTATVGPTATTVVVASSSATTGGGGSIGTGGTSGVGGEATDGGSPCDQACAHAASCGLDVCTMYNINCANVPAMYDCVLTCLDGVQCSDFQQGAIACYQMCQNMGNDGGGPPHFDAGPPPFDAGPGVGCAQCLAKSCQQQSLACAKDMGSGGCLGWLECQAACYQASPVDPTCFDNCDAMFPNAAAEYEPVYACACSTCGSDCAAGDPCSHVGDGG